MRKKLLALALVFAAGCADGKGGGGGGGPDEGFIDYDGTYAVSGSVRVTDTEGLDESHEVSFTLALDQVGPAVSFDGIVALSTTGGLVFNSAKTDVDMFGNVYTMTYAGGSVHDDPFYVELAIDGGYEVGDYAWTYAYTLTLGEKLYD